MHNNKEWNLPLLGFEIWSVLSNGIAESQVAALHGTNWEAGLESEDSQCFTTSLKIELACAVVIQGGCQDNATSSKWILHYTYMHFLSPTYAADGTDL